MRRSAHRVPYLSTGRADSRPVTAVQRQVGRAIDPVPGKHDARPAPAGGMDFDNPLCSATKADGSNCRARPTDSGLCAGHNRALEAAKRKAG